ncbi:cupin domain-containing protein [Aspergillus fijiensis CBS 313.89]|uniref:RmlC-like cupin n=1 Tax=Aspergillus fijiensis CBS 313.89 TaxID=1448319 RepID=A0A8G1RL08_9EURO|nr:RmlC-like cupin [Aspergillus fijiensis CBS 313.89]RAK75204.1 RmlC-like cupin [Aspergillus fijiensis CBS 313.89]
MSKSIILSNSSGGHSIAKPTATFTGDVYLDMIHFDDNAAIANVTFTPCARTHWHTHEHGQFIKVVAGSGWICDKGDAPRRIKTGDLIWAPAGTTHWHGADDGTILTHLVVGLGKTVWHDAVTDDEYPEAANLHHPSFLLQPRGAVWRGPAGRLGLPVERTS